MVSIERKRQFKMWISEEEHAEMRQLSEWQRLSVSDVARMAIHNLYLQQSHFREKKGVTR